MMKWLFSDSKWWKNNFTINWIFILQEMSIKSSLGNFLIIKADYNLQKIQKGKTQKPMWAYYECKKVKASPKSREAEGKLLGDESRWKIISLLFLAKVNIRNKSAQYKSYPF